MNVIAVDDEHLALVSIEHSIKKAVPDIMLTCFDSPTNAINYSQENKVDLAFLDIEMGGMTGIQLAKCLKDINAKTNIIFTTGYSKYALDAYAIHASGYLMKPVTESAITEAMDYLFHPVDLPPANRIRIQTFGNFEIFVDDKPLVFSRSKTKEMLAYLVMQRGARCSNNEIVAVIWENRPDSYSLQNQYRHLVMDLRKTLEEAGADNILLKQRGTLAVIPGSFSCDLYDFFAADISSVNKYMGEFMSQYSWAEFTNAYLEKMQ